MAKGKLEGGYNLNVYQYSPLVIRFSQFVGRYESHTQGIAIKMDSR